MKRVLLKLILLMISAATCFSESKPKPVASINLNSIVSDQAIGQFHSVTAIFLSDSKLAVAFQSSPSSTADEHLVAIFKVTSDTLSLLARRDGMAVDALLFGISRTVNGQLVVFTLPPLDRDVRIYDANLAEAHRFYARPSLLISPTGGTLVVPIGKAWNVFRTNPIAQLTSIPKAPLSVSDDDFTAQDGDNIVVNSFDGIRRGLVRAPEKCANHADFVGEHKLYVEACRRGWTREIVDFSGRSLISVKIPKGWGHHQTDTAGDRMVFDIFTESKWAGIKALKDFEDVADGEAIRVMETNTGNMCFSLDLRMDKAHEGPMHVSISPSGKLLTVVNDEAISVFELPSGSCAHP
jgi:hypothetical protein